MTAIATATVVSYRRARHSERIAAIVEYAENSPAYLALRERKAYIAMQLHLADRFRSTYDAFDARVKMGDVLA